ncbi:putative RNA methyltransferase [Allonocardiopsis opalescens]|uniref:putative RNA methyltransferase n=1 Tax=Allonocardiopsis opalescens TaxID=1144618 RepID=UPI000D05B49A
MAALRCPLCGRPLRAAGSSLRCPDRHSFDRARQGYVNLLPGGADAATADTAPMVAARESFLAAGHYAPLTAAVAHAAARAAPPGALVLDAGAGTGHYLAAVLDALPGAGGLALDLSKYALRRAARAHPAITAAVWDLWRPLPVADGAAGLVLNVFAPRNPAEFRRVLAPGGALLVVTPTADHLAELVEAVGTLTVDADKDARLERALAGHFAPAGRTGHRHRAVLGADDVERLVRMGPTAHHLGADELRERISRLESHGPGFAVTVSCTLSLYRPA